MEWINVSEYQPPKPDYYNVTVKGKDGEKFSSVAFWDHEWIMLHKAYEYNTDDYLFSDYEMEVIAWSELPAPKD